MVGKRKKMDDMSTKIILERMMSKVFLEGNMKIHKIFLVLSVSCFVINGLYAQTERQGSANGQNGNNVENQVEEVVENPNESNTEDQVEDVVEDPNESNIENQVEEVVKNPNESDIENQGVSSAEDQSRDGSNKQFRDVVTLRQSGNTAEALEVIDQLLFSEPENLRYLSLKADIHFERQEWEDVSEQLLKIQGLSELEAEQKAKLGRATYELGNFEKAKTILEEVQNEIGDGEHTFDLVRVLADSEDYDGALNYLNRAFSAFPDKVPTDYQELRSRILAGKGNKLASEEEERRKAIDKEIQSTFLTREQLIENAINRRKEVGYDQFTAFSAMGESEAQSEENRLFVPSKSSLEILDKKAIVAFNRGNDLYLGEQYRRAIGNYDNALRIDPTLLEAHAQKGMALYQLENYRGSVNEFDRALEKKSFLPRAYFWRAKAYQKLNKPNDALDSYILARKGGSQLGDAYVLFESSIAISRLVQGGAKSSFQFTPPKVEETSEAASPQNDSVNEQSGQEEREDSLGVDLPKDNDSQQVGTKSQNQRGEVPNPDSSQASDTGLPAGNGSQ